MCDLAEVEEAVAALEGVGDNLALLHCTSEYPAAREEANLLAVKTLSMAFGHPVGYSDHTEGTDLAAWAVVAGASIIEKHFTLDRGMDGPDHRASIEPKELAAVVKLIRLAEAALGTGIKRPLEGEIANRDKMRKSLVAACDIVKGQTLSAENLASKRPGTGLPPKWLDQVVGKRALADIGADTLLRLDSIDWDDVGK
jgi:sialic acid synthase SpsE